MKIFADSNCRYKNVENFLKHGPLEIENIQRYFPIARHPGHKWKNFNCSQQLIDISCDTPNQFRGIIRDNITTCEKPLHVKLDPILDPILMLKGAYSKRIYTPTFPEKAYLTYNSIYDVKNPAYYATLCSLFLSQLSEQKLTPHFGLLYDVYVGICSDFQYDASPEWSLCKSKKWFRKALHHNNIFELDSFVDTNIQVSLADTDDKTVTCNKMPVVILCMEKFKMTFNDFLKDTFLYINQPTKFYKLAQIRRNLWIEKIKALIFQILAALTFANNSLQFVHNDLHIENVMLQPTQDEFLFYSHENTHFKVPTFGYIVKIIDFGRSTFVHNGSFYKSNIFNKNNAAGGQYSKKVSPSPSFDLARFACSWFEEFDKYMWTSFLSTDIGSLLYSWTLDDHGEQLLSIDGFDLYIHIAKHFREKKPCTQIFSKCFNKFQTQSSHDFSFQLQ